MKPTANIWHDKNGFVRAMVLANDNPLLDVTETPLYTAHQIADFVRGLYFDDDFSIVGTAAKTIADKIEEI